MGREPDYRAAVRGGAHSAADRQSPDPRFVLPRALLRTRDLTTARRGRREPEIPSAVFRYLRIRLGLALRRNAVPQTSLSIPPILALLARCAILRARVAPRLRRGSFRNRRGRGRVARRNPPASARRRSAGGRCASDAAGIPREPVRNTPYHLSDRRHGAVLRAGAVDRRADGPQAERFGNLFPVFASGLAVLGEKLRRLAAAVIVVIGMRLAHRPAGVARA